MCITLHGPDNVKFTSVQQAKQMYRYKNTKEKLQKANTAIWYNNTCRQKFLMPNYISIQINGNNQQCRKMIKDATQHCLKPSIIRTVSVIRLS